MPNFEEAAAWTVDEVKRQNTLVLPKEWTLVSGTTDDLFTCTIKDNHEIVRWQEVHPDLRFVLLSAYGWLVTRDLKNVNPVWSPRRELTQDIVRQHVTFRSSDAPDPEDLSPEDVRTLYEQHRNGR